MPVRKEDIKSILDEYRRLNRTEFSASDFKAEKFKSIYDDFMKKRSANEEIVSDSFFYFVNKLNKLAKNKQIYCGVDMADFAKKLSQKHDRNNPFDVNLFHKDENGIFVMKQKSADGWEWVPIERELFSVFTAFVQIYLDFELQDNAQ